LNQYRPRLTIYTLTTQLRWPMTWTPMALHEARDGKLVSGQNMTKLLGWREGRKRLKRSHTTWDTVRMMRRSPYY
jgi:hypothetical protein